MFHRIFVRRPQSNFVWLALVAIAGLLWFGASSGRAAPPTPGLRVIDTPADGLVLEFNTPDYELSPSPVDNAYVRVIAPGMEDGQTGLPGEPRLPAQTVLVAIPPQAEVRLQIEQDVLGPARQVANLEPVPFESVELRPEFQSDPLRTPDDPSAAFMGTKDEYVAVAKPAIVRSAAAFQPVTLGEPGYLRDQRFVPVTFQPFEYSADGMLRAHRQMRVVLTFVTPDGVQAQAASRPDPYFETTLAQTFVNYEQAKAWRAPEQDRAVTALQVEQDTGARARIYIDQAGLYSLGYDDLIWIGVPVNQLDARTLRLHRRGVESAMVVTGEEDGRFDVGDTILFYGEPESSRYSNETVYWLSWGGAAGLRMTSRSVAPTLGGDLVTSYIETLHQEKNVNYLSSLPATGEADRWYWDRYSVGTRPPIPTLSYDTPLSAPVAGGVASLQVAIRGFSFDHIFNPDHRMGFFVNDNQVGVGSWDGQVQLEEAYTFSSDLLADGNNVVRFTAPGDTGTSTETGYLNWFEIRYPRQLLAVDDHLQFARLESGRRLFRVDGFSSGPIDVLDVSDAARPVRLLDADIVASSPYALLFSDDGSVDGRYYTGTEARRLKPLRVELDQSSQLRSPNQQADYLMISHVSFLNAMQPLVAHRTNQGYKVALIDVQDVYDEFNDGNFSPLAIRDFIDYAYHNWQAPAPTFVLLVGDGHYDYLDYKASGRKNYIPPLLEIVDPFIKETATDNRFVTVAGDDIMPDLFIGRFPVNSATEVTTMVNKTIGYENAGWSGDWERRTLFVADNSDNAGNFATLSDQVADTYLPAGYDSLKQKIYLGVNYTSPVSAREAIKQALNAGVFLSNYAGHGQVTVWAAEFLFSNIDASGLINGGRLPVHLSMTCLDGQFQSIASDALAEQFVRNAAGGAVAVWAATGLGVAHGHDYLHQGFYDALFNKGQNILGALVLAGKTRLYTGDALKVYHDLIDTYNLLGDPALRLPIEPTDLSLELLEAPAQELSVGDTVQLRYRVANVGTVAAPDVEIELALPPLNNVQAAVSQGAATVAPGSPTRVQLSDIAPGEHVDVTVWGTLADSANQPEYTVTAFASTAWRETDLTNNAAEDAAIRLAAADLFVTLSLTPEQPMAGGTSFALQADYTNIGRGIAAASKLTIPLPPGAQDIGWTASDPAVTLISSEPLIFDLGNVGSQAAGSVRVTGIAGQDAVQAEIQATVQTSWADANPNNNASPAVLYAVAGADPYEPDNTCGDGTLLNPPETSSGHSYFPQGDQDWFRFVAEQGVSYTFRVDLLTAGGDSLLILYDANGNELKRNDNANDNVKWSSLTWTAEFGGDYCLLATRSDGGSPPFVYDLVASRGFAQFIPIIWKQYQAWISTPTPTPTKPPTPTRTPTPTITPTPAKATPTPTPPPSSACLPTWMSDIDVNGSPWALAATENQILAGLYDVDAVAVIDGASQEVMGAYGTNGDGPGDIAIWQSLYYVTNRNSNRVSVFDVATGAQFTSFAVGSQPWGIAVTPSGYAYVANTGSNTVSVHNAITGALVRNVQVDGRPQQALAFGETVWVTRQQGVSGLVAIDGFGSIFTPILGVPAGATYMKEDSRTGYLYVSHPGQRKIYVVDTLTYSVRQTISVPATPYSLEINSITNHLYVIDAATNTLYVLALNTGKSAGKITIGAQSSTNGGQGLVLINGLLYISNDAAQSIGVYDVRPCVSH